MKKRLFKSSLTLCTLLTSLGLLLSSCGQTATIVSTITPTIIARPKKTPTAQASTNATTSTIYNGQSIGLGKDYAFLRNNQVWVALNGADPVQATHFVVPATAISAVHWSQLHWFAQGRYLAFTVEISARGGNYCLPLPIMGQLFVLDTSTMQTTAVTTQGIKMTSQIPIDGLWSSLTFQDDTHLLAWSGGLGIYRYDFTTQTVSLVVPQKNVPAMQDQQISSMSVRNGQFYYFGITPHDAADTSHFVIYSSPLSGNNDVSTKVFDAGSETICSFQKQNGSIASLGWDISPDGTHLVTLVIDNSNPTHPQGKIELIDLQGGTTTPIFTLVPAEEGVSDGRIELFWSPDGHNILLRGQNSIYTSSIENPATFQKYNAQNMSNVRWQANGTAFTADDSHDQLTLIYRVGNPEGKVLLTNDADFSGGNQ